MKGVLQTIEHTMRRTHDGKDFETVSIQVRGQYYSGIATPLTKKWEREKIGKVVEFDSWETESADGEKVYKKFAPMESEEDVTNTEISTIKKRLDRLEAALTKTTEKDVEKVFNPGPETPRPKKVKAAVKVEATPEEDSSNDDLPWEE